MLLNQQDSKGNNLMHIYGGRGRMNTGLQPDMVIALQCISQCLFSDLEGFELLQLYTENVHTC